MDDSELANITLTHIALLLQEIEKFAVEVNRL